VLVARIVEDGFLLPLEAAGPERTSFGGIDFQLLYVPGISHQPQHFRASVTNAEDSCAQREVLVVWLSDEIFDRSAAALSAHFQDELLAFVREDRTGCASVSCAPRLPLSGLPPR